ncbi:MAG: hypothetical protein AAF934_11710, partial [Bacteroidota bacterium]
TNATSKIIIMRKIAFTIFCLFMLHTNAQEKLSVSDWQHDLKFLQTTVHKDYAFLFKKTTSKAFDAQVDKLYKAIPTLKEHEIIVGLARIVSSFQYGHTVLGMRSEPVKFHRMPFNLYHFNDGVYIQAVHKEYQRVLGAELIAVEGVPVAEALAAIRPVVPAENDQFFKAYGLNYLGIPEVLHAQGVLKTVKNTVSFTFKRNGKTFKQRITAIKALQLPSKYGFVKQEADWLAARSNGALPLYLKNLDKIYYFQYLPEHKALYVRHSQIQDDPQENIPDFYKRVFDFVENNAVERLIIDVRLNGGGNNYKNKAVVTGIIRSEKINQQGKLFVIIGRRTFSACQNLVNELDTYTNAIFVGEPTAENINFYGDNHRIALPKSKIPVFLSFAWWQDKPQWENGPWTAPHVAVDMSFEDYRTNKDPVLETALNFSDTDFILDPMQHLTELFMAGKLDAVKAEAKRMVAASKYRFFDFERQLNRAGYNLMGGNQMDGALFVFQLNTELFPNSANAWESLAEIYMKMENMAKATEYYRKVIQMDSNGAMGKKAREMLKKINKD